MFHVRISWHDILNPQPSTQDIVAEEQQDMKTVMSRLSEIEEILEEKDTELLGVNGEVQSLKQRLTSALEELHKMTVEHEDDLAKVCLWSMHIYLTRHASRI